MSSVHVPPSDPNRFTLKELSQRWRVSQRTVLQWATTKPCGKPPLEMIMTGGKVCISAKSVEAWDAKWCPDFYQGLNEETFRYLAAHAGSPEIVRTLEARRRISSGGQTAKGHKPKDPKGFSHEAGPMAKRRLKRI